MKSGNVELNFSLNFLKCHFGLYQHILPIKKFSTYKHCKSYEVLDYDVPYAIAKLRSEMFIEGLQRRGI